MQPFKITFLTVILLICSCCLVKGQFSRFVPEDTAWYDIDDAKSYPWRLRARTGLFDEYIGQDADTVVRRVTKYYINDKVQGYLEYLPEGYSDPLNTKNYPLILYTPGCGEMHNGQFYLHPPIPGVRPAIPNYNYGLGRFFANSPLVPVTRFDFPSLPSQVRDNGGYFSRIPVKTKGLPYNYTTGEREGVIIMMLMPSGTPELCKLFELLEPIDIDQAIALAFREYRIDPSRIYITGMSRGARQSWLYTAQASPTYSIAAVAPVASVESIDDDVVRGNNIVNNGARFLSIVNAYDWQTLGNDLDPIDVNTISMNLMNSMNGGLDKYQTYFFLNGPSDGIFPIQPAGLTRQQAISDSLTVHDAWSRAYNSRYGNDPVILPVYVDPVTGQDYTLFEWFLQKPSIVLPVTVTRFTATRVSGGVSLNWVTSTEINSKVFTIERSPDGRQFTSIAQVPAAGNSTNERKYQFVDDSPGNGKYVYYRLTQTDIDGRKQIIGIRKVFIGRNASALTFRAYPNISYGIINLEISQYQNEELPIRIIDALGRVVTTAKIPARQTRVTLDITKLSSGMYVAEATAGTERLVLKFMKQ